MQNGTASAEKLQQTELAEKERVALAPQSELLGKMPELLLPKEKETVQITRS